MLAARDRRSAIMFTYGAHLIKNGAGPLLNRLIEVGLATHLATQGAGIIHDWGSPSRAIRGNRFVKTPRRESLVHGTRRDGI